MRIYWFIRYILALILRRKDAIRIDRETRKEHKKMATKQIKLKLTDDQLTEHLKKAEEELIAAVKLFANREKLSRRVGYLAKLVRAQEIVTGLHAEELIRKRGTLKPPKRAKGRLR